MLNRCQPYLFLVLLLVNLLYLHQPYLLLIFILEYAKPSVTHIFI